MAARIARPAPRPACGRGATAVATALVGGRLRGSSPICHRDRDAPVGRSPAPGARATRSQPGCRIPIARIGSSRGRALRHSPPARWTGRGQSPRLIGPRERDASRGRRRPSVPRSASIGREDRAMAAHGRQSGAGLDRIGLRRGVLARRVGRVEARVAPEPGQGRPVGAEQPGEAGLGEHLPGDADPDVAVGLELLGREELVGGRLVGEVGVGALVAAGDQRERWGSSPTSGR